MCDVKNRKLVIGIICMMIFASYVWLRADYVNRNGIITLVKIINVEGAADGEKVDVDVYVHGKFVRTTINKGCSDCINKYFYAKILKNDISTFFVFYEYPVSNCILKNAIPIDGWKSIPSCQ